MANKHDIFSENIPGSFYVDQDCIACDTCTGIAPNFFNLTQDNDHAYLCKQPMLDSDKTLCLKALEQCPVGSIGDDGD